MSNNIKINTENIKNVIIICLLCFSTYCYMSHARYKSQVSQDLQKNLDSLNKVSINLKKEQDQYDSLLIFEEKKIKNLNTRIASLKTQIDTTKRYYEDLQDKAEHYMPTQIDSFFRKRYKY